MGYKSEKIFLDEVEKYLKLCGCKTWKEVVPDACKNWEKPYRVDLIFYRDDFGYIAAEGKNINTLRSAKKVSDAIDQIQVKYRNQTYFNGNFIERWCIIMPMKVDWISDEAQDLMKQFLKNFLNLRYKISLMEYIPTNNNYDASISIDTTTKNSLYIRNG